MALQDYFELSGMLRAQLPVLLSFAMMRCFMGHLVAFATRRLLPSTLYKAWQRAESAAFALSLAASVVMLGYASATCILFWPQWKANAEAERPPPNHPLCSEFACTRAQGLACGIALLAMMSRSDAFTLAIALSLLKGVADGSGGVLFVSSLLVAACDRMHHTRPARFFALLFAVCCTHAFSCYSDADVETRGRVGCSVLAICFACVFVTVRCVGNALSAVWRRVVGVAARLRGEKED